jgi:hypothetical protein
MYQIPTNVDWSCLTGRELIQVCFGEYQTQLRFERDLLISVEGEIEHRASSEVVGRNMVDHHVLPSLTRLVGTTIEHAVVEGEALLLSFSNGDVVRLIAGNPQYECFAITFPGGDIIV